MNREEQLEWEARWSRPAAAAAVLGGVLPVAGQLLRIAALSDAGRNDRGALIAFDERLGQLIASTTLSVLGFIIATGAMLYLWRASRARREETFAAAQPLLIAGVVGFSIAAIINLYEVLTIAGDFVDGPHTERRADDLLKDRSLIGGSIGLGGGLALVIAVVMISVGAMRAGLLSRFMGILGVIVAAFNVLNIFPLPIVQVFWFCALAVLFLDRWPGGRGPAWAAGEAIPWPSAMDQAKAREEAQQRELPEPEEPSAPKPSRKKRRR